MSLYETPYETLEPVDVGEVPNALVWTWTDNEGNPLNIAAMAGSVSLSMNGATTVTRAFTPGVDTTTVVWQAGDHGVAGDNNTCGLLVGVVTLTGGGNTYKRQFRRVVRRNPLA